MDACSDMQDESSQDSHGSKWTHPVSFEHLKAAGTQTEKKKKERITEIMLIKLDQTGEQGSMQSCSFCEEWVL